MKCDTCKNKMGFICDECIHDRELKDRYEPMTNGDRIRAMSDEELAEMIAKATVTGACNEGVIKSKKWCNANCEECILEWLKQPMEV